MPASARPPAEPERLELAGRPGRRERRPGRTSRAAACPMYSMPRSYWSVKKYGSSVVDDVLAEHRSRRDGPAVEGVGPVLDPDPGAEDRVLRGGHVTGGVDVGCGRPQRRVDGHAVVDREPGGFRELERRPDPDADDDRVGIDFSRPSNRPPIARRRRPGAVRRRCPTAGRHRVRDAESAKTSPHRHRAPAAAAGPPLSSTVTSAPWCRAAAATSSPIQPAPMTTTGHPR